jgi:hypothetical protein
MSYPGLPGASGVKVTLHAEIYKIPVGKVAYACYS